MAKFANDAVMDAALDEIKNNGKVISVCSGQPSSYDDGFLLKGGGGRMLAKVTVSAGSFTGPVNGDPALFINLASLDGVTREARAATVLLTVGESRFPARLPGEGWNG